MAFELLLPEYAVYLAQLKRRNNYMPHPADGETEAIGQTVMSTMGYFAPPQRPLSNRQDLREILLHQVLLEARGWKLETHLEPC